jgi:tripartite-type tricarboxylate transporter receptor subunit TctC
MEEAGYKGFVVEPWFGYMVPKGTPPAVIAKLNSAFNAAVQIPRVKSRLEAAGVRIVAGSPDRLGELMKTETERWGQVIRANKIQPN